LAEIDLAGLGGWKLERIVACDPNGEIDHADRIALDRHPKKGIVGASLPYAGRHVPKIG
jgi:hypothetical protein